LVDVYALNDRPVRVQPANLPLSSAAMSAAKPVMK